MMDMQRLMAATLHSSLTIQQALASPLITPDASMRPCKRLGCGNWFAKGSNHLYCTDPDCQYLVRLERYRRGNAKKKARGAQ